MFSIARIGLYSLTITSARKCNARVLVSAFNLFNFRLKHSVKNDSPTETKKRTLTEDISSSESEQK